MYSYNSDDSFRSNNLPNTGNPKLDSVFGDQKYQGYNQYII